MQQEIKIRQAEKKDAHDIAQLIMLAMNMECCRYFAGEHHTLCDFENMMTLLVENEHSQYSYRNTVVAMVRGNIAGICVSYNGAELHQLREAFVHAAKTFLDKDFSKMDDETQPGELYIDSLAVKEQFRHQGVATALLKNVQEKAQLLKLNLGLLVDQGNPNAEKLYT